MSDTPLIVVGAGPAGMSAAIAAAECGDRVTLFDENPNPGGQIYRQSCAPEDDHSQGNQLRRKLRELADRIEVKTSTRVWGVFDEKRLAVSDENGWRTIETERLILAPGAYELVPPFPGWALPGVYTPGGAQTMVKSMGVLPGRRALVVGTGPFLLVVANYLHKAGVQVATVVDTVRRTEVVREIPSMLSQPGMMWEGWQYLRQLKRAGIPLVTGHVVVQASGSDEVEKVTIARCDKNWSPDKNATQTFDVDTLCVGYGFVPRIQLAQLAGCELAYNDDVGGWLPVVDENGQSSVPNVWCVGDGAGVAGALVAESEGTIAGLAAAKTAGLVDSAAFDERTRTIKRTLKKLQRFRAALDRLSRIRTGLSTLATDDTIVCRCEELTRAEVEAGVEAGSTTLRALKVATRLGMGPCQGRMCWPSMARMIAATQDKSIEELGPLSVRPPVDAITLGDLAKP